ncbi:RWD domain-containing protein 2A [Diachasmimorpha longicaudata]|uniref:RWD domain-containing protein 2A n=1 Tax=Diachasmimorpha longicaudata TaxID=58733 RepID=UPI0030B8D896
MSDVMKIREYLATQVIELETLQAVYPDELVITDHGALADINQFISGGQHDNPGRLAYSIKITVPEGSVDLHVTLPPDYPGVSPDVYARGSALDRTQQTKFNDALIGFAKTQDPDEPCIYAIISWMQDHLDGYLKDSRKNSEKDNRKNKKKISKPKVFGRYWIYSHHIYSNIKRKDMADEAKECQLSGFCLAGKPGIICVEGALEDCEYWWQKIKVMNWHKILLKLVEEENLDGKDVNTMRKFTEFQEISFPTTDKHNDMGQLLKYLTEHQSQHVFKEFFGVEGKMNNNNN